MYDTFKSAFIWKKQYTIKNSSFFGYLIPADKLA